MTAISLNFNERIPCRDETCTGIINERGVCGTCGKPNDMNRLGEIDVSDALQFQIKATQYMTGRNWRFNAEVSHKGLMKTRSITSSDKDILRQKIFAQVEIWDEMWVKQVAKSKVLSSKEEKKALAYEQTEEAQALLSSVKNILQHTLSIDDKINWEALRDKRQFKKPKPEKRETPPPPDLLKYPHEPKQNDPKYTPEFSLAEKLFTSKKEAKLAILRRMFREDYESWKKQKLAIQQKNEATQREYEALLQSLEKDYENDLKSWDEEKEAFKNFQKEANEAVEARKRQYLEGSQEAIIDYCDMVLSKSAYPQTFPKEFELEYITDTKTLVVEYRLPSIDDLPNIKEVKYVQSRDDFTRIQISEAEKNRIYDDAIYQISLRTIHELFEADQISAIDAIAFNGWVKSVDKATGQEITPCILSIHTKREEFTPINLSNIDPKACFKKLKGVGSSKLYSLTAIAPILQMNKEDRRFIPAYAVADSIKEGDNLAIMDWEDFEHLIREIFEKEFSQYGGEVKITQASRDWGVDAVVFDPDPLRGGKIIIQAKRYSNTVTSSAVRDLYGTVVNEGAIKGILVTTSDYGPDAYSFAKDKPLTLLNGANLLHMLAKHGHKARIDLAEAKKILAEEEKR